MVERPQRKSKHDMPSPLWIHAFGSAYAVPSEIASHPDLVDISYKNDVCPSFAPRADQFSDREGRFALWIDHPDPEMRENGPDAPRVMVTDIEHPACGIFESETDIAGAIEILLAKASEARR